MAASHRKYTAEYRNHAVELVRESGKPIAGLRRAARDFTRPLELLGLRK